MKAMSQIVYAFFGSFFELSDIFRYFWLTARLYAHALGDGVDMTRIAALRRIYIIRPRDIPLLA